MRVSEVSQLLLAMAAAWPSFGVDSLRIQVWTEMIADIKPQVAVFALQVLMARKTFPPSIGEFRQVAWEIETPETERLDEGAAWEMVNRAIDAVLLEQRRNHSAFHDLPPKVLAVCRQIGLSEIVNGDLDVVRNNFLRLFQGARQREREQGVLPVTLREAIAALASGKELKALPPGFGIMTPEGGD